MYLVLTLVSRLDQVSYRTGESILLRFDTLLFISRLVFGDWLVIGDL